MYSFLTACEWLLRIRRGMFLHIKILKSTQPWWHYKICRGSHQSQSFKGYDFPITLKFDLHFAVQSPLKLIQNGGDFADDLFIGFSTKKQQQFLSLIQISLTDLMKSRTRIFITNILNVLRVCTQIRSYPLHKKLIGSVWENGGWFSTLYMTKRCCIYLC